MAKRNHRCTSRIGQVSLRLENRDWSKCVGVQPLVSDGGFVRNSHLFFTCRGVPDNWKPSDKYEFIQRVAVRKRIGEDNAAIMEHLVPDALIEREVLSTICDYGKAFAHPKRLYGEDYGSCNWRKEIAAILYYQMKYIRLCTLGGANANFIVSSDTEQIPKLFFPVPVQRIIVGENLLDRNTIIVGASPNCVYANPIAACPILPREGITKFCEENGFDLERIVFDPTKKYPMIEQQLDWYEIYKLYIENVGVESWYIERFNDFKNIADYYSIIRFAS